ncbi:MAG TPA: hypothetical protein VN258_20020 [Mobilitalea sp.]|nr:hypothetical protein [Mobilitalea sp.]
MVIVFLVCVCWLKDIMRSKKVLISVCIINIFINIAIQLRYYIQVSFFTIPWFTLSLILFHMTLIVLALATSGHGAELFETGEKHVDVNEIETGELTEAIDEIKAADNSSDYHRMLIANNNEISLQTIVITNEER